MDVSSILSSIPTNFLPYLWGWVIVTIILIVFRICIVSKNGFGVLLDTTYESMAEFFASIMEEPETHWTVSLITGLFFVVLLYNLLGLIGDFFAPMFGFTATESFVMSSYIGFATSDYHFNIAMAVVGILIVLYLQWRAMTSEYIVSNRFTTPFAPINKTLNFLYEYLPIFGKGVISVEQGTMNPVLYYPLLVVVKLFDIVISLFVGILDIIGVIAKIISLSFRLFGNMISGTALLTVLVVGFSGSTQSWFGLNFPLIAPIILLLQGLLVACIQAFVFPLLLAIFAKIAMQGSEANTA